MIIIDEFLGSDQLAVLCAAVLAPSFPWGTTRILADPLGAHLAPQDNTQQVHGFYLHKPGVLHASPHLPLLRPLLRRLQPTALLRIKLNRTARNTRHVEYGLHADVKRRGATTAIYYLNTNNGYTVFEDGRRIASVADRIVLFDTALRHTGASCTDAEHRLVLNFNMMMPPGPLRP